MTTRFWQLLRLAVLTLAAHAASAQSFGEFLRRPELPLTFMGVDFSQTRYFGQPMTVDSVEMKGLFTRIDRLFVTDQGDFNLAKALHRTTPVVYRIDLAESVNARLNASLLITRQSSAPPRQPLTSQAVAEMVTRYAYPAGSSGVGLVFIVEDMLKNIEQETFWLTFVDLQTRQVLYTERLSGRAHGGGFRGHWAAPLQYGIGYLKSHYKTWLKQTAGS